MQKLCAIALILSCLHLQAQSTYEIEKSWMDSKAIISSYKNPFAAIGDSGLVQKSKFHYGFTPEITAALEQDQLSLLSGLQFTGLYTINPKWNVKFSNRLFYSNRSNQAFRSSLQPKAFFDFDPVYDDLRARIEYNPNKVFDFQAGIDKHFLGEGDRSLLLGNQGVPAPFVSMKLNFRKFEYLALHQVWRDGEPMHYVPKANATHYLNFNHENKISIGIFETVVHVIKDTLYNRGYEVEYLNPLIFYRPQEYSLGSSDNVILGMNGFIKWKNHTLYGQFVLDDLNIQEIRKKSGWWANKYGAQAGYKAWYKIRQSAVFFRTEISFTTPYTFASINEGSNYVNQGLTLSNPLGSNFIEWYSETSFNIKKLNLHAWGQVYMKGEDPAGSAFSYGGDPRKSYLTKPSGDFGYYLGSGEKTHVVQLGAQLSRSVTPYRWKAFIEPRLFVIRSLGSTKTEAYFTAGLQSAIFSDKRNY